MSEITMIGVNHLYPHQDNPRKVLGDLTELADSIKANGVFQNLTVVPKEGGEYTVIIGHRRLAAAKQAGIEELPCAIVEMTPQEQLRTMLVENMQRSDLTVYEQAQGIQLMLDMGETVDSIAKGSGFSTSTIRRRVKLLELDQEKFRKSVARGATLSEYMELDKIEDPERKNAVLDSIGTPNFRNKLQSAIDDEKCLKRLDAWEEEISKFAMKIETHGEVNGEKVPMEYDSNYSRWSGDKKVYRPDDVNTVKYYYTRTKTEISVYRTPGERSKSEAAAAREERQAAGEKIRAELREITKRHFNLRNAFISSLSQSVVKKHLPAVAVFAMYQVIGGGGWRRDMPEPEVLNLCFDLDLGDEVDFDELRMTLAPKVQESPEKSILFAVYAMADDAVEGYWDSKWNCSTSGYDFYHKPNDDLDRLYMLLDELGYEMSDEEKAMQDATHELLNFEASHSYPAR